MKNLSRKKERRFFDVHPELKSNVVFLKDYIFRFEFNVSNFISFIKKNKLFVFFISIFIILLFIVIFSFFSKAQTVMFFPSSCLGGWENPKNAEGNPNVVDGDSQKYTSVNSAILFNRVSDIFCGSFLGDVPKNSVPKIGTITFSWAIKNGININENLGNSSPDIEKKEEQVFPNQENASEEFKNSPAILEPNKLEFIEENNEEKIINFLHIPFLSRALEKIFPSAVLAEETVVSSTLIEEKIIHENDSSSSLSYENLSTSSINESSSSEIKKEETHNDSFSLQGDSLLKIEWSINGNDWNSLGYINDRNYRDAEFKIPFRSWEEFNNFQIKIKSLNTQDVQSAIFLDAIILKLEVEEGSEEISEDDQLRRIFRSRSRTDLPNGFSEKTISMLYGIPSTGVIISMKNNEQLGDDIWFFGKDTIKLNKDGVAYSEFPIGIKGGSVYWINSEKNKLFRYDLNKGVFFEKIVPPFDSSNAERAEIIFEDSPWKVIIGNDNFYFWSEKTGEVFSDGSSLALQVFREIFNLDYFLTEEKLSELNFSPQR